MNHQTLARVQSFLTSTPFEMSAGDSKPAHKLTTPAGDRATAETIGRVNSQIQAIDPNETIGAQLTDIDRQHAFLTAGKAIFTIQGEHNRYTFKIDRKPASDQFPETYFVSMLTGPDNLNDYTYVGLLDISMGTIKLTRKSAYTANAINVKAFNWTIGRIIAGKSIDPAKIYHVGRCGRCGRALTVPSSIEAGIGPECAGKLGE